ncbi:hypothetical protein SGGMMB4_02646 [Sodalis glossinidius str. 'morsitans']|uniref:Uncharacterized protein n=1 Tax=Sodalis glossinidius (strain morsitans) TaxID=343509 RepID=A0A193QIW6_SODGM|nr:hypothetical protein SGGMMB4_02646 [Sodalis glossinidius str. 'morsitans']
MYYLREKAIEQQLIRAVKATGGIAYKFVSPSRRAYLTVWSSYLVAGCCLWNAKRRGRKHAPPRGANTTGSERWGAKSSCWMIERSWV